MRINRTVLALFLLSGLVLAACRLSFSADASGASEQTRATQNTISPQTATQGSLRSPSASPTIIPTSTTAVPSATASPTATRQPSATETPTIQPTYRKLRAEVIIAQAVCHYGPGAPYLYKYGVYLGSHLEVLRRVEPGNYLEIQAIGGSNPCWVKADYLQLENGSLQELQPVSAADVPLPWSPYYPALNGVSAARSGDEVTVSWHALGLRAGDDSEQMPYIVEAWVCQQGQTIFLPQGAYQTAITIHDEPGCAEPSRAWVTAAEKHGYTRRVAVVWPPALPESD